MLSTTTHQLAEQNNNRSYESEGKNQGKNGQLGATAAQLFDKAFLWFLKEKTENKFRDFEFSLPSVSEITERSRRKIKRQDKK